MLAPMVEANLGHWHRLLQLGPDEGSALVVSSGGSIEPVLVAALTDADHASWGSAFHQLEGQRPVWDGDAFCAARLLRQGAVSNGTVLS